MSKGSVRQPLVLYATVFMLLFGAIAATIAGFSLIGAARRTYRRAITDELRAMAASADVQAVQRELLQRPRNDVLELAVVTATMAAAGVNVLRAREAVQSPEEARRIVAVRVPTEEREAYLVAYIDPTLPASIALSELAKTIPAILLAALATAGLLALMMRRLLLPSLTALAEVARDPSLRPDGLVFDAPNEILEVAQSFRHTIRQLEGERELIEAKNRELAAMQTSLVRASKLASVGRLAAGIAHEIGNPLAAVQGYLSLLPRLDEGERKEVVERSSKELLRIHETIKKLLTYARQEEPAEPPGPIVISQVVRDAVLLVRGHPSFRGVHIEWRGRDVAEGIEVSEAPDAIGHAGRLGQVLVNLLLNAAQAIGEGEVRRVQLTQTTRDDAVELTVADSGPGVPEDKLEQIFDPFYTTKAPGEGTGLGLAVSRSLVEAMGGDLTVVSPPGDGARFTVRLSRA